MSAITFALICAEFAGATPLNYADGYNVFVFNSLKSSSDIGGRVAAGTNLVGNFDVGNHLVSSPGTYDVVAGNGLQAGSQVKVNSAGNAYVPNGIAGSNVLMNGGGHLVSSGSSPIDFNAAKLYFYQLSGQLSQLSATGSINNGQISASSSGLNVFNLSAAEYLSLSSINTDGGVVVINVSGTPGLNTGNMTVNGQQNTPGSMVGGKVLFNFFQDNGTLVLPNVMGGSVLAPGATVAGSFQYNGTIVANALDYNGEIHSDGAFTGDFAPTPEPASYGLAGLGALACLLLKRQSRVS